jgi:hypothetical protein
MNEIAISNLDLAAFLLVRGFMIDRLDQNGKTIVFIFNDPKNIGKQIIAEYYKNALVPVKSFNAALRECRDLMFDLKRQTSNTGNGNQNETYSPADR